MNMDLYDASIQLFVMTLCDLMGVMGTTALASHGRGAVVMTTGVKGGIEQRR